MKFEQYETLIKSSKSSDYVHLSCESSPSFTEVYDVSLSQQSSTIVDVRQHDHIYTLKQNLNVSIRWGMADARDQYIQLGQAYPDSSVRTYLIDYFFAGSLIWRDRYHAFDGHRVYSPECTKAYKNEDGYSVYVFNMNALEFMRQLFPGNWELPRANSIGDAPHLIESVEDRWAWRVNRD